jgi:HK97 family phage prohead protease
MTDRPTLFGHFAVTNIWTEINSMFEGHFMERIVPGAMVRTIAQDRDRIRSLFQHGHDPQIGEKPLGPIETLREDDRGGFFEVSLLDTDYVRELVPGLEQGVYGASFRFRVIAEDTVERPSRSGYNPTGLPERTIRELELFEVGPVTWPAYAEATADVRSRSMTDWDQIYRGDERSDILVRANAPGTLALKILGPA